ncbi:putative oxoglutarate/iron-dependent dioxygenase, alpha-ketoglutarate-dependent dioxygenase AlkB [Lupinus albus]|uniref:Putative oxoglutarate/iron-dependent dioxygenase, alpha-ketoglutarate-dependent dioxygenase AlkB n=1 Tax=Lupinus albus TaxID=3870 RepID=A0A6A4NRM7_LUPAL|nr:putative oxoglutarate/iron-dependent dioxygenase, alpha-ketoglutarate-dependent dioxygenase AlkB [Lupinus albus]
MPMAATTSSSPSPSSSTMLPLHSPPILVSDSFAKDSIISWFRGEFAAANAIIDALCSHLTHLGTASDYNSVFTAIHRRRLNWIPVIQMQKYHSIADVALQLRKVTDNMLLPPPPVTAEVEESKVFESSCVNEKEKVIESDENGSDHNNNSDQAGAEHEEYDSPVSEITDSGSQEMHTSSININICSNHEECEGRSSQIKLTKGFSAKESIKGHMVNVVKGLKLYEDIFTDSELCKLTEFVNELHNAGQNGELSGETFILFNKQMKGNKRELIQLGVPIFGQVNEDAKTNIEPIPALLERVIDHLIQWQLLPQYKRPNGCIINFFDEGEFSQPFLKPPHLDQPLSTLLLSESTMAFGRILMSENDGNYKGQLMLSLKKGSLVVMRGNSADMARHVMCPSPNTRVSITFFRVRPDSYHSQSPTPTMTSAMAVWQPAIASPYAFPNGAASGYEGMDMMPKWGMFRAPMVMLTPMRPTALNTRKVDGGGTGVFLPWNVPSRKHTKHLPPRAQKGRFLALPPPVEQQMGESTSEPSITVEG